MTETKRALPASTNTGRGPMADFLLKTAIAAGVGLAAFVVAIEWTLASLDDFVNRSSELAITRLEQAVRSNSQIVTADLRNAAQATVAELRDTASFTRVMTRAERGIEWLADPATEMSPERRERLLSAVRVASERWRPVLLEALAIAAGAEGADLMKKK
jgi:hypothetical protein